MEHIDSLKSGHLETAKGHWPHCNIMGNNRDKKNKSKKTLSDWFHPHESLMWIDGVLQQPLEFLFSCWAVQPHPMTEPTGQTAAFPSALRLGISSFLTQEEKFNMMSHR